MNTKASVGAIHAAKTPRAVFPAMLRGALGRCPACGEGHLFRRYLKVADHCPACGEALFHQRADDAPPYFTIFIAGHLLVPVLLAFEVAYHPALWVHALIWIPVTILLCMALLPVVKGAIVGLQWALYMHGFDPDSPDEAELARG
ncbi:MULTISPECIES: DUF983 domain-containing protein [Rhodomicrobium]|uniref:DUF983 domain-containing protein n=1 Tax=Rhodomicrobium TaxID=1068 RepID=UPI000B4ABF4E|nr:MULTISPECIES: DUF983 domain-containing protein [Rhodomicrobium]